MPTVTEETVLVKLTADTRGLDKGLKKAEDGVSKSVANIKKAVAVIGSSVVLAQLVKGLGEAINSFDELAKTANKIGTTAEQLSRLQYAAEFAGVSTTTLNMAMQRFTRRAAEAANGTGEAQEALSTLGIEAKTFNKLTLEDKMQILADSMGNVTDRSEKLRLAFKLFDSEGTAVLNMLEGGSSALKKYGMEADRAGVTVNNRLAHSAEIAADHLSTLDGALKGVTNEIASNSITAFNAAAQAMLRWAGVSVIKNLQDAQEELRTLRAEQERVTALYAKGEIGRDAYRDINKEVKLASKNVEIYKQQQEGLNESQNIAVPLLKDLAAQQKTLNDEMKMFTAASQASLDIIQNQTNHFTAMYDSIFPNIKAIDELQQQVDFLDSQLANGTITLDEYNQGLDNISKSFSGTGGISNGMKELVSIAEQLQDSIGSKLENAFSSTFRSMMDGTLDLKETMTALLKDIAMELIRVLVIKRAVEGITGEGGIVDAITGSISGTRAAGGPVTPNRSYLVGENGPEIFTPSVAGGIDNGRGSSGMTVNIINQSNSEVSAQQDQDGLTVIIKAVENSIAAGITRRTSPVSGAVQQIVNQGR